MTVDRLCDSAPDLGSSGVLRERFSEDGYLYIAGLIDRDAVLNVRSQILQALAALDWTAPGTEPEDAVPGPIVRREGDEHWRDGYVAIQSIYDFHALSHHPALFGVARDLIQDDLLVHPRSIARVTYPGSEHPTPPHQDFPLIQGAADVYTAWVPFGEIPQEMGALRVLRGSHVDGLKQAVAKPGVGGIGVEVDQEDPRWADIEYRPGDVVIFHAFTVHFAPPNTSDRMRLSADYRYQSVNDPVVSGSLVPHGYPDYPHWDLLAKDWPDREPITVPDDLNVVDRQVPLEAKAPASRLVRG